MKIRKSKYHQKSVKVVHCGALIWRKFSTNCDAHLAERFLKGRNKNRLRWSIAVLSSGENFPQIVMHILQKDF